MMGIDLLLNKYNNSIGVQDSINVSIGVNSADSQLFFQNLKKTVKLMAINQLINLISQLINN